MQLRRQQSQQIDYVTRQTLSIIHYIEIVCAHNTLLRTL